MVVLPPRRFLRRSAVVGVVLVQLLELLLLKNLPPLTQPLGGAAGDLGGYLLPLVAVLGLQRDDEILLLRRERALLNPRLEVVLPPLEAGLRVPI